MTFERGALGRVLQQPLRLRGERGGIGAVDVVAIGVEVDRVLTHQRGHEIGLAAGSRTADGGRRRDFGGGGRGRRWRQFGRRLLGAAGQAQAAREQQGEGKSGWGRHRRVRRIADDHGHSPFLSRHGRTGPHAGSDASTGVGNLRSLRPVRSTCQIPARPEPFSVRKNCTIRPLGDQVGASSCQLSVR